MIICTSESLLSELSDYSNPHMKIKRMVRDGELIHIKRGLYETNPDVESEYLAYAIYGPSYLSFDYALSYQGIIPESVRVCTSATTGKFRRKTFETPFGYYSYRDVPQQVFEMGVLSFDQDDYRLRIASAEKAVCDKIYTMHPVDNVIEMGELMFEDLRFDESMIEELDKNIIEQLVDGYHSKNVKLLSKVLEDY